MGTPPPVANARESTQHVVATVFREEWGRIVAALIHRTGDWDLAEECAQDAFTQALARWPSDGVPPRPGAWLMPVARNRAIDRSATATSVPPNSGKLRRWHPPAPPAPTRRRV